MVNLLRIITKNNFGKGKYKCLELILLCYLLIIIYVENFLPVYYFLSIKSFHSKYKYV